MKPLSTDHAKQLFCWHAFLQPSPLNGFEELVEKFLKTCSGLPLSLKVLGGQLYGNLSKESWESQLDKISRFVHKDVKDKLKISYDALDDEEKEAFLDIACFFIGENRDLVIEVWNGLGSSGLYNLEKLRNKCLVEVNEEDYIRMHDHLRNLGREIANRKSPYRLWFPQQNIEVCNEQIGIGIRGIKTTSAEEFGDCLSHPELMVNTTRGVQTLAPSRHGPKFIVAQGCNLNNVIREASRDLVWLRWLNTVLRNLQSLTPLKSLRVLEVGERFNNHWLRELWVAECDAPLQLRELVIDKCLKFQRIPKSIGILKHLKKIILLRMECLESLPEEFCLLQSLEHLELRYCSELLSLPNSMGNLKNLRHLSLLECVQLGRLPDSCKELMLLQRLSLRSCRIVTFMSDIMENMSKLDYVDFSGCNLIKELPRHITNQASLRELDLGYMRHLREVPMMIGQLSRLQKLCVGSETLTSLLASLGDLSSLTTLEITFCDNLECLPDSVGHLSLLKRLDKTNSGVKSLPESISQLINLESLTIEQCLVSELNLGSWSFSSSLCKLKTIYLLDNDGLSKISISKDSCAGLETLRLEDNSNLTEIDGLPSSVRELFINECPKLSGLPSFAQLTSLQKFVLKGCYKVQNIEGLNSCNELEVLKAYTGWEVPGIQNLECMERLKVLHLTAMRKSVVEGCIQSLKKWPSEIIVCTRAVQNAVSIVNSLAFPTLSVVDSCSYERIDPMHEAKLVVKQPSNGNAISVCFVVWTPRVAVLTTFGIDSVGQCQFEVSVDVEEGRWVWIGLFTQWCGGKSEDLESRYPTNVIVEKGFLAIVEKDRVMEVFPSLMGLMEI